VDTLLLDYLQRPYLQKHQFDIWVTS
jgi:hypothetical protein